MHRQTNGNAIINKFYSQSLSFWYMASVSRFPFQVLTISLRIDYVHGKHRGYPIKALLLKVGHSLKVIFIFCSWKYTYAMLEMYEIKYLIPKFIWKYQHGLRDCFMNTLMKTPKLLPPSDNGQSLYYSSISQNKHIQWKGEKGYGRSESSSSISWRRRAEIHLNKIRLSINILLCLIIDSSYYVVREKL